MFSANRLTFGVILQLNTLVGRRLAVVARRFAVVAHIFGVSNDVWPRRAMFGVHLATFAVHLATSAYSRRGRDPFSLVVVESAQQAATS